MEEHLGISGVLLVQVFTAFRRVCHPTFNPACPRDNGTMSLKWAYDFYHTLPFVILYKGSAIDVRGETVANDVTDSNPPESIAVCKLGLSSHHTECSSALSLSLCSSASYLKKEESLLKWHAAVFVCGICVLSGNGSSSRYHKCWCQYHWLN